MQESKPTQYVPSALWLRVLRASVLLEVLALFLPWFTFNAELTGYVWGFHSFHFVFFPFAFVAYYLFQKNYAVWMHAFAGLCLLIVPAVAIYGFFTWHVMTITGRVSLEISLYTTQPTFWVSLAVMGLTIIVFLVYLCRLKKVKPVVEAA